MGEGLALGIKDSTKDVTSSAENISKEALAATRGSLTSFASILSSDMDADPVVRPVVDLSNIDSASKAIGTMPNQRSMIGIGVSNANARASAAGINNLKKLQNGGGANESNSSSLNSNDVNLTGNNFYVRSESDIYMLASEIASLTHQQQRSYGAT